MNNSTGTAAPLSTTCSCNATANSLVLVNNFAAAVVNVPIAVFIAVSNAVVILTIIRSSSLHRPANILICSLAFGDLFVGIFAEPAMIVVLLNSDTGLGCCFDDPLFQLHLYSSTIALGSFVQICVMCWDRYKAVSGPVEYRSTVTNKKVVAVTVTAWVMWFTVATVMVFVPPDFQLVIGALVLGAFVSTCIISQIATLRSVRVQSNLITGATPHANLFAREKKMAIMFRWILGACIFCAIPAFVHSFLVLILGEESLICTSLHPWAVMMLFVNSGLNPLIYCWRHSNMRSQALQLMRCSTENTT